MEGKAVPIVDWIKSNVPPLTWTIIKLKYLDVFMDAKIAPSKIDETTIFNDKMIQCINETLEEKFNKRIPTSLTG